MNKFDIDRESEELGAAQDRAIKRMAERDFEMQDVSESLHELSLADHEVLIDALQDNDNTELGKRVNNALFHYLTNQELEHE